MADNFKRIRHNSTSYTTSGACSTTAPAISKMGMMTSLMQVMRFCGAAFFGKTAAPQNLMPCINLVIMPILEIAGAVLLLAPGYCGSCCCGGSV